MIRPLFAPSLAALLAACTLHPSVTVAAVRAARVEDARTGAVLCPRTPCVVKLDRPWPTDSSRRFVVLRAIAEDGSVDEVAVDTHDLGDGVTFRFASEAAPAH